MRILKKTYLVTFIPPPSPDIDNIDAAPVHKIGKTKKKDEELGALDWSIQEGRKESLCRCSAELQLRLRSAVRSTYHITYTTHTHPLWLKLCFFDGPATASTRALLRRSHHSVAGANCRTDRQATYVRELFPDWSAPVCRPGSSGGGAERRQPSGISFIVSYNLPVHFPFVSPYTTRINCDLPLGFFKVLPRFFSFPFFLAPPFLQARTEWRKTLKGNKKQNSNNFDPT